MIRPPAAALIVLSAGLTLIPTAFAQDARIPLDAVGNERTSQAPYVQPADRPGRVSGVGFAIRCLVSCPAESIDVMEFRSGGDTLVRKLPGRYHAGDVTVCGDKRTMKPFLDWFRDIKSGRLAGVSRDLVLELLGKAADGRETVTCQFNLRRAWPHQVNWAPDGSACLQLAVESTELVSP